MKTLRQSDICSVMAPPHSGQWIGSARGSGDMSQLKQRDERPSLTESAKGPTFAASATDVRMIRPSALGLAVGRRLGPNGVGGVR